MMMTADWYLTLLIGQGGHQFVLEAQSITFRTYTDWVQIYLF